MTQLSGISVDLDIAETMNSNRLAAFAASLQCADEVIIKPKGWEHDREAPDGPKARTLSPREIREG